MLRYFTSEKNSAPIPPPVQQNQSNRMLRAHYMPAIEVAVVAVDIGRHRRGYHEFITVRENPGPQFRVSLAVH